jgi:hypothetical protein
MNTTPNPTPTQATAREALQELVALKDLKAEIQRLAGMPSGDGGLERYSDAMMDYERRKPRAWQAARAVLAATEQEEVCLECHKAFLSRWGVCPKHAALAQVKEPAPAAIPAWKPLSYATPLDMWKAFKAGTKFVLHYHGKTFPVAHMQPRELVAYVMPPGMPVKVYPDGRNCESAGDAIWLEEIAEHTAPAAGHPPEPFAVYQSRYKSSRQEFSHAGNSTTFQWALDAYRSGHNVWTDPDDVLLYTSPNVPASQAQGAGSQPTGAWKRVPIEPTEEMLHAAAKAWQDCNDGQEILHEYRAMLAAVEAPR